MKRHILRFAKSLMAVVVGVIVGCSLFYLLVRLLWPTVWLKLMQFQDLYRDNEESAAGHPILACIIVALPLFLVVGLPVQAMLQRFGLNGYSANVGVCIALGAVAFAGLSPQLRLSQMESTVFILGLTLTVGSLTWLIRRPDKDKPAKFPAESHF
ncbi:MAG: hypothetical protein JF615_00865 [Asticcacaulis sp.]|nr:hypothetical protein [Asticcacaulis sp.]